jgi:alkanesulfonate monooxygenase SsuD/methylene tetrahydromethanopterin reductase-like flavin-dependent oxidoreductase (luciferase family)
MPLDVLGTSEHPTFGLDTFGDVSDRPDGRPVGHPEAIRQVTDDQALEEHFWAQRENFARIGRKRGWSPLTWADYDAQAGPTGAYFVGSPETVAQKVAWAVRTLGLSRFQLKYAVGDLSHERRLESIRLYGDEVIPRVRELLSTAHTG